MQIYVFVAILICADVGMYFSTDKDCRKERAGFLFPLVGGFAAFIHCEGKKT